MSRSTAEKVLLVNCEQQLTNPRKPVYLLLHGFFVTNMNTEYLTYLKSPKWKSLREKLFSVRGEKCERCTNKTHLQIHHKTYKRLFNERLTDLEILCLSCHEKEHGRSFSKPRKEKIFKSKKRKPITVKSKAQKTQAKIKKLEQFWKRNDCAKK